MDRLGVLTRLHSGPADAPSLARDCAIDERGARALLAALPSSWSRLADVMRDGAPLVNGDTTTGAQVVYPGLVAHLATLFAGSAEGGGDLRSCL